MVAVLFSKDSDGVLGEGKVVLRVEVLPSDRPGATFQSSLRGSTDALHDNRHA